MALGKLPDSGGDEYESDDGSIFAEINITPLTDVFLVMLIIFMVVSAAALQREKDKLERVAEEMESSESAGLKINLPSGAAQEIDPGAISLVVTIPPEGAIVVNDQQIADENQLDNIFRSAFTRDKDTQVVIKADAGVHHGRVVGVMEKAKRVGLTRLAIATSGG
ncbi:ExbD/TolR family protein [Haliangium ochraceum]|uniref:Biopolymer transport protein ExbD/TolR n=1 Tax=Haliangium ochraceum (strain DSM 14365 / JCM 11303 / SMP-2) TaxID=502025 RepID=D0LGS0_HALO1|nr:biopolymer transporter ExbD [Haliangium ochraceum]ACY14642.1 Biopolymer transport protein ExbD/TolR [Haliangium ochraceum DSM 14365]